MFGQLVYLVSLLLLVTVIGDAGLTTYLLRAAGSAEISRKLLARATTLRLSVTIIAIAGAAALLLQRNASNDLLMAFALASTGIVIRAPAELVWSILRGQGRIRLDARARLLSTAAFASSLAFAVAQGDSLTHFGWAWITWGIASLLVSVTVTARTTTKYEF